MDYTDKEFQEILKKRVGNDPKSENWKISSVINDRDDINVSPEYQRGEVWNNKSKSELIISILINVFIPPIIVNKTNNRYDVIDGKQRLTSIYQFIDNEFPLIWNGKQIYYSESSIESILTKEQRKTLTQKALVFCVYENLNIEGQRSIFERINFGADLTVGEKLKGSNNKNVQIITDLKDAYKTKLEDISNIFKNNRDSQYLVISAICAILTGNEEFASIGDPSYKWIISKDTDIRCDLDGIHHDFSNILDKLISIKSNVLEYLKNRKGKTFSMLKRCDILMFIYALKHNPDCSKDLVQFSKYLFHVSKESIDIYSKSNNSFLTYKKIGAHGTNNNFFEDKYKAMNEILSDINKKNSLNENERAQVFGKTFTTESITICKICLEDPITLKNFDAAHIISRKNGGIRHMKNFIATCRNCNQKMGSTDIDTWLKTNKKSSLDQLLSGCK
jgi:hypothetical protein